MSSANLSLFEEISLTTEQTAETPPHNGETPSSTNHHTNQSTLQQVLFDPLRDVLSPQMAQNQLQGVLWKRRDVFKKRWRPRWFVWHASEGVLTYYLLKQQPTQNSGDVTPPRRPMQETAPQTAPPALSRATRNRESNHELLPRGTIDLRGCTVTINHTLSEDNFFVFTIRSHDGSFHLATKSNEARQTWVEELSRRRPLSPDIVQTSNPNRNASSTTLGGDTSHHGDDDVRRKLDFETCDPPSQPTRSSLLYRQAFVLAGPLLLYFFMSIFVSQRLVLVSFLLSVYVAVKEIYMIQIGRCVEDGENSAVVRPVCCRFSVDMKGILRFVANANEVTDELNLPHEKVSLVHILVTAIGKALATERGSLCRRRHSNSLLGISCVANMSLAPIDVSLSSPGGDFSTVHGVENRKVKDVADEMCRLHQDKSLYKGSMGHCLVVMPEQLEVSSIEMSTMLTSADDGIIAIVVVDGVKETKNSRSLLVSLTTVITNQQHLEVCRRFAAEFHKLLQYPEICDN